jgi:hypothetical protein
LTAMKYGVYALLAVVVGVMLVGLLPGQLSNLAAPTMEKSTLASTASSEPHTNQTVLGDTVTISGGGFYNDTVISSSPSSTGNGSIPFFGIVNATEGRSATSATSAATAAGTKSDAAQAAEIASAGYTDPYADLKYYGMMGVGLIVALAVYFAARRIL